MELPLFGLLRKQRIQHDNVPRAVFASYEQYTLPGQQVTYLSTTTLRIVIRIKLNTYEDSIELEWYFRDASGGLGDIIIFVGCDLLRHLVYINRLYM